MDFKNINFNTLKKDIKTKVDSGDRITETPSSISTCPTFLKDLIELYSKVPIFDGNISKIIEHLKYTEEMFETSKGRFSGMSIVNSLYIMYYIPRSIILKQSMTKVPKFASFTPLFMYAHKSYNNIPYEFWNKNDAGIHWVLGPMLEKVNNQAKEIEYFELSNDEIKEGRIEALTWKSGKKAGQIIPLTGFRSVAGITINDKYIPNPMLYMILQLWICNSDVRDTTSMILDPWNWDRIPEALDEVEIEVKSEVNYKADI